ncbi:hypothetical protein FDP41_011220 [Naegleria fowleri]|uniref:Uncharacterized protein n=1 Tax=Naegleria fowleri TaxID=5763 RepID=A0A6A5C977_NAEFO|nr:uncharacterized protein FDP41_011220 [Naegleria fowleri]KAF0982290.1 hypothetical protein FDP41_011220 [Naegleria fowleri]CAG4712130.1 unnamed protein product [Naegleria fowleri]
MKLSNLFACFLAAPSPNTLTAKKHPAIAIKPVTSKTDPFQQQQHQHGSDDSSMIPNVDGGSTTNSRSSSSSQNFKKTRSWRFSFRRRISTSPSSDDAPKCQYGSCEHHGDHHHIDVAATDSNFQQQQQHPLQMISSKSTKSLPTVSNKSRSRAKSKSTGSLMSTTNITNTVTATTTNTTNMPYKPNVVIVPALLQQPQQISHHLSQQHSKKRPPKQSFKSTGSISHKSAKLNLTLSTIPPLAVQPANRRRPPGQSQFTFEEHTSQHFSKRHVNETFMDWIQTTPYFAKIEENLKKK